MKLTTFAAGLAGMMSLSGGASALARNGRGGKSAPEGASVRPPVHVRHEWDALRECVVGRGEDIVNPGWSAECEFLPPKERELKTRGAGRPFAETDPESARKIVEQVETLARTLAKLGVTVHRNRSFTPEEREYLRFLQEGSVAIFTRDPMLTIGNNVIETSLRAPFRRKERFILRPALSEALAGRVANHVSMPQAAPSKAALDPGNPNDPGPYLEGADVLLDGEDVYAGLSGKASDRAGVKWLARFLGPDYRVHAIRLKPGFLHLDGVLSLPGPDLAVICPGAFLDPLPARVAARRKIPVTSEEALRFGANGLILDERRVIWGAEHGRIIKALRDHGREVMALPCDEVSRMGGGFRRTHHPLWREG